MMTVIAVAERFHCDPVSVLRWPNALYLDVLESLEVQAVADERREAERNDNRN
jgi:hypothetical protein